MVIIHLKATLFNLDNIFYNEHLQKGAHCFKGDIKMDEKDLLQEYIEKLKQCDEIIKNNKKIARQLRAELKEVEDLKQQLQQLIELNSQ